MRTIWVGVAVAAAFVASACTTSTGGGGGGTNEPPVLDVPLPGEFIRLGARATDVDHMWNRHGYASPEISANGRWVAFTSIESGLTVDADPPGTDDLFVLDRQTDEIVRVTDPTGAASDDVGRFRINGISDDGAVAFVTTLSRVQATTTPGETCHLCIWTPGGGIVAAPQWTDSAGCQYRHRQLLRPDGSMLLICKVHDVEDDNLLQIRAAAADGTLSAPTDLLFPHNIGDSEIVAVSPSSRYVVFQEERLSPLSLKMVIRHFRYDTTTGDVVDLGMTTNLELPGSINITWYFVVDVDDQGVVRHTIEYFGLTLQSLGLFAKDPDAGTTTRLHGNGLTAARAWASPNGRFLVTEDLVDELGKNYKADERAQQIANFLHDETQPVIRYPLPGTVSPVGLFFVSILDPLSPWGQVANDGSFVFATTDDLVPEDSTPGLDNYLWASPL